jgi:hypothetical protein
LTAAQTRRSAPLRVRGALQLLSLQVITVNWGHPRALPTPRAKVAPTRRTGVRLGARQARSRAGRAERGAIAAPSQRHRPAHLCAGPPPRARRRQPNLDRLPRRQESPAKSPRRGLSRAGHRQRGKCHRERRREHSAWSAGPYCLSVGPQQAMPAAALLRAASYPNWRTGSQLLPLRYFAAVPGP